LRRVKQAPHGIDLGPLAPCLPERLFTEEKRIQLAPPLLLDELKRLQARSERPGLVLIGRRHLLSNNSWMHNYERLVRGRDRCTLLVHPDDAARLNIADGRRVRVTSRVGAVEVGAEISDEVMPGVVSLPHGWGHGREGVRLATAERHP